MWTQRRRSGRISFPRWEQLKNINEVQRTSVNVMQSQIFMIAYLFFRTVGAVDVPEAVLVDMIAAGYVRLGTPAMGRIVAAAQARSAKFRPRGSAAPAESFRSAAGPTEVPGTKTNAALVAALVALSNANAQLASACARTASQLREAESCTREPFVPTAVPVPPPSAATTATIPTPPPAAAPTVLDRPTRRAQLIARARKRMVGVDPDAAITRPGDIPHYENVFEDVELSQSERDGFPHPDAVAAVAATAAAAAAAVRAKTVADASGTDAATSTSAEQAAVNSGEEKSEHVPHKQRVDRRSGHRYWRVKSADRLTGNFGDRWTVSTLALHTAWLDDGSLPMKCPHPLPLPARPGA